MKKSLLSLMTVLACAHTILHAITFPINQTYEQLAEGHLPPQYYSQFKLAAADLGIDISSLHVRVPKEEACQMNPYFNQIAYIPGSGYLFINPTWFDSLSPEAQRFAAAIHYSSILQPISTTKITTIFTAAEIAVLASVAPITYKLLGNTNLSPFKKGLLAFFAACVIELPIELIAEKKAIASHLKKRHVDRLNTIIQKLNNKTGAIEYYQKHIDALKPYATHNPSIQVMVDTLMADLRIIEEITASLKNYIDKKLLYNQIKDDIYKLYIQEMWRNIDWNELSQGNEALKQDLIELYDTFDYSDELQKDLDEFCKKWGLEAIKMAELWNPENLSIGESELQSTNEQVLHLS